MKKIFVVVCLAFVIVACSKDKFETKPQISLKSITEFIPRQGAFEAIIEFTDKEGDQDTLFLARQKINRRGPASTTYLPVILPVMPSTTKGEIVFGLDNRQLLNFTATPIPGGGGNTFEPDSVIFKFYLKDKANNASDTLFSPLIVITR